MYFPFFDKMIKIFMAPIVIVAVFYPIIFLIGVYANTIFIGAVYSVKDLHSPVFFFLSNECLSDVIFLFASIFDAASWLRNGKLNLSYLQLGISRLMPFLVMNSFTMTAIDPGIKALGESSVYNDLDHQHTAHLHNNTGQIQIEQ